MRYLECTRERLISKIFRGEHAPDPLNMASPRWPDQTKFYSDGPGAYTCSLILLCTSRCTINKFGHGNPDPMRFNQLNSVHVTINNLTHYQTTNIRLFQTERVCRRQFQI